LKSSIRKSAEIKRDILGSFDQFSLQFEKELYERLLELISKLTNKGGVFVLDEGTFKDILKIVDEITKKYKGFAPESKVKSILQDFDELEKVSLNISSFLSGDLDFDKLAIDPAKKLIISDITEKLSKPESFKNNVANDIRKIITKRAILGSTTKELISDLKAATSPETGLLSRYVKQVVTDSTYQFQGNINQQIYTTYEMDAITYANSLKATSRKQCIRWVTDKNGLLLKEKIEQDLTYGYLPDEIKWAKNYGSGYGSPDKSYYLDLTESNFLIIRGGYGCQHEAIPFKMNLRTLERSEKLKNDYEKYRATLPLV